MCSRTSDWASLDLGQQGCVPTTISATRIEIIKYLKQTIERKNVYDQNLKGTEFERVVLMGLCGADLQTGQGM